MPTMASIGRFKSRNRSAIAEMMRSACAYVRRCGAPSVKRARLGGSMRAIRSGWRWAARRKRSSKVARASDARAANAWSVSPRIMRASLRRCPPPGFRQIAVKRRLFRMIDMRPARDPLLRDGEERHSVKSRLQHAILGADGCNEVFAVLGLKHGIDQRINSGAFDPHVVARAFGVGCCGSVIEH